MTTKQQNNKATKQLKPQPMLRRILLYLAACACSLAAYSYSSLFFANDRLSNTCVTSICQDKEGYIWIGTENGLNRFDGYKFSTYKNNPQDTTSLMFNNITKLFCDRQGNLWVGTNNGLQRYDPARDCFVSYHSPLFNRCRITDINQLPDGQVIVGTAGYGLFGADEKTTRLRLLKEYKAHEGDNVFGHLLVTEDGTLWKDGVSSFSMTERGRHPQEFTALHEPPMSFAEADGKILVMNNHKLYAFDNGKFLDDYYDVSEVSRLEPYYWTALTDSRGNIYIGTRGDGLFWIPSGTRKVERFRGSAPGINMNASTVQALFEDRSGNIWVACWHKGLFVIPGHRMPFTTWSFSGQKRDIGNYVSSICRGDDGTVWCTVCGEGVFGFAADGQMTAHPSSPAWVEFIQRDSSGNYYLGAGKEVYAYNPADGNARLLFSYTCNMINAMLDDGQGHLFFSAFGRGLLSYDKSTGKILTHSQTQPTKGVRGTLCNDWILSMAKDRDGHVWIATTDGVCCHDAQKNSFLPFGWSVILKGKRCESLCESIRGDMLIGTMEGLYVWHRSTGEVKEFPDAERLRGLTICHIVQDNGGDIWCSTTMGIWHYSVSDGEWIGHVSGSGLTGGEFVPNAGMFLPQDNRLFFATNDGIVTFTPEQVREASAEKGEIRITGIYHGGEPLRTGIGRKVFSFPYSDNVISMEFSLMNFIDAANTVFEYRLNGNEEWVRNAEGQNAITFAHLPIGTHRLEVRAVVGGTVSSSSSYTIVVEAPWYRSTAAYVIYCLALIALAALAALWWRRRINRQLDENKMKFLINATHDIRSPLTLIMSPLEKLRNCHVDEMKSIDEVKEFDASVLQPSLKVIDSNARRILNLVNQILDIRKIDKRQMTLSCRKTDLRIFLQNACQYYEYSARERKINFMLSVPQEHVWGWIDRTQFEKVIANLLSNAFKYTYDSGNIKVVLTSDSDSMEISVTDDGTGLDEAALSHLFDRFYQGQSSHSSYGEGTGIGLNLCKMIVDMHHGTITARNRDDGQRGSVFCICLPQGKAHLAEGDTVEDDEMTISDVHSERQFSRHNILLIDDDVNLTQYIANELQKFYHFTVCHNGQEGYRELLSGQRDRSLAYDVVISDIMMPKMDGFTLLRLVRSNPLVSHVPVILLTSKSDIGNRLEGIRQGADAYLTKPFVMSELQLTIDNLITKVTILRNKVKASHLADKYIEDIEVKGNDEFLMERILKCINDNIGNNALDINLICTEVGISRSHLHRKMKELSGITVHDFIINIRMEQAARMLTEQRLNVTQVAYAIGYSNQPTFSAAFRRYFGCSPTEYVNSHMKPRK